MFATFNLKHHFFFNSKQKKNYAASENPSLGFWNKHFASKSYAHQLSRLVTWNHGNLLNFFGVDSTQIH